MKGLMRKTAATGLLAAILVSAAWAVQTTNVQQDSSKDFEQGKFENAVVNNRGQLSLAHKVKVLLKGDKEVVFVNAVAADSKGVIYAATAPAGKLFRIAPGQAEPELYYQVGGKTLLSLAVGPHDELYVGTGGGDGQILQVTEKGVAKLVLKRKDLAYVWSIGALSDGRLVAGTGPKAELLLLTPGDKPVEGEVLYAPEKNKQKNVLTVAVANDKTVYFGTDTDGLVFRYDLEARRTFLLFDAPEAEIAALVVGSDGNVYASTSDPRQGIGGEASPGAVEGHPAKEHPTTAPGNGSSKQPTTAPESSKATPAPARDATASLQQRGVVVHDQAVEMPADRQAESGYTRRARGVMVAVGARPALPMDDEADQDSDVEAMPAPSAPQQSAQAVPDHEEGAAPTSQPEEEGQEAQPKAGSSPEEAARMRERMGGSEGGGGPGSSGGNAVYRIDAQGFATEIIRQKTMLLSMVFDGGRLVLGTGTDGRVLAVSPGTEEVYTLARLDNVKQVLSMVRSADGSIMVGTANEAMIARIDPGYSPTGQFTSSVIDAKQVSQWGIIRQTSDTPDGTAVTVQTRSGNLAEPDDKLWSAWSEPAAASDALPISSPPARFLQYRLLLSSKKNDASPVVRAVTLAYANANQAPKIASVRAIVPGMIGGAGGDEDGSGPSRRGSGPSGPGAGGGGEGPAGGFAMLMWQAADPNGDPLEFNVYVQREGTQAWIPLTANQPIRGDNKFRWVTRGVPDGRYRAKVVATDAPGNPTASALTDARTTDLFVVDNTAPDIQNFKAVVKGGKVLVSADAVDALSHLASGEIRIDSDSSGQVVQPADGVWDEQKESISAEADLAKLASGPHLVILAITDAAGNVASAAVEVVKP